MTYDKKSPGADHLSRNRNCLFTCGQPINVKRCLHQLLLCSTLFQLLAAIDLLSRESSTSHRLLESLLLTQSLFQHTCTLTTVYLLQVWSSLLRRATLSSARHGQHIRGFYRGQSLDECLSRRHVRQCHRHRRSLLGGSHERHSFQASDWLDDMWCFRCRQHTLRLCSHPPTSQALQQARISAVIAKRLTIRQLY